MRSEIIDDTDIAVSEIKKLEFERISLQNQFSLGIISKADVVICNGMNANKKYKLQKQLVDKKHRTSKDDLRSIVYHSPTDSYPEGYWYTKLEGKVMVKAKTKQMLYEKLYDHYYGKMAFTVKNIFDEAIDEKKCTENLKEQTIKRYYNSFNQLFTDDFKNKEIASISDLYLKKYTQQLVNQNEKPLTKKQYLAYKGILNIIFGYSLRNGIITDNPVDKIKNKVYLKSCNTAKPVSADKIFSEEEIQLLINEVRRRMALPKWTDYYPLGFALIFSSLTGCRVGELCAVKWADIDEKRRVIHFHAQQTVYLKKGHIHYIYDNHTKNEKGLSQEGRLFPLYDEVYNLLKEIREKQTKYNITSEYIFCLRSGDCLTVHNYTKFLRRICQRVGLSVTNNHAFRMGLNSNVLIPCGFTAVERAEMLGHSVETNLENYSFVKKDYLQNATEILSKASQKSRKMLAETKKEPQGTPDQEKIKKKKPQIH